MRKRPFTAWAWHGVGRADAWDKIRAAAGLTIPTKHIHDSGDYGLGVYLTLDKRRAASYAVAAGMRIEGRRCYGLVKARIRLENPIYLDWRKGNVMDPTLPSSVVLHWLTVVFGDPIRGTDQERADAARRWREGLLGLGHDGVVARYFNDTEIVLYKPQRSILQYECVLRRGSR